MMIPPVRRTWAPPGGQTPVHRHHYRRDRLSVIGGLSVSPRRRRLGRYFRIHAKNISQGEVHDFLGYRLRHRRGRVIVVGGGAPIHDPKPLSELLRKHPRLRRRGACPPTRPNSTPIEAAWHAAKQLLANGRPEDLYDLGRALLKSLRQAGASQPTLRGCVAQSELPPFFAMSIALFMRHSITGLKPKSFTT